MTPLTLSAPQPASPDFCSGRYWHLRITCFHWGGSFGRQKSTIEDAQSGRRFLLSRRGLARGGPQSPIGFVWQLQKARSQDSDRHSAAECTARHDAEWMNEFAGLNRGGFAGSAGWFMWYDETRRHHHHHTIIIANYQGHAADMIHQSAVLLLMVQSYNFHPRPQADCVGNLPGNCMDFQSTSYLVSPLLLYKSTPAVYN